MSHLREPRELSISEIEAIEKQSLRSLYIAAFDLGFDAFEIFRQSSDEPKDIAEDITREMLDRLGGYQVQQRILGNVDYRKTRYIILPEFSVKQALFVDSKAEKETRTATLQMSQLSLTVHQRRGEEEIHEQGKIPAISTHGGQRFITTTLLGHYYYEEQGGRYFLKQLTLAAIPNGMLQGQYNPNSDDSIWLVGRNAPSRGEDFRVRLGFNSLALKAGWRVQRISYDHNQRAINSIWNGGEAE